MGKPVETRRCLKRAESGVQLVELAIVLPIFLVLLAAVAEFGRYFYTYTTLAKATRVGARYLSSRIYTEGEKTKARNLVVCGSLETCSSGSEIISGLTTGNVAITTTGSSALFPQTVTVQIVGYNYQPVFDLAQWVGGSSWSSVEASPSTTMRYLLEN